MIKAYDFSDPLALKDYENYKKNSTISEDPNHIKEVTQRYLNYRKYQLELDILVLITELLNNEELLNKISIVSDLSYRNCAINFSKKNIRFSFPMKYREAYDKILNGEFERLFFFIEGYEYFNGEEIDEDGLKLFDYQNQFF